MHLEDIAGGPSLEAKSTKQNFEHAVTVHYMHVRLVKARFLP